MTRIYDICIAAALNGFWMSKLTIENCTCINSDQYASLTDVFCDIVWRCRDESSLSPAVVKCAPEHRTWYREKGEEPSASCHRCERHSQRLTWWWCHRCLRWWFCRRSSTGRWRLHSGRCPDTVWLHWTLQCSLLHAESDSPEHTHT